MGLFFLRFAIFLRLAFRFVYVRLFYPVFHYSQGLVFLELFIDPFFAQEEDVTFVLVGLKLFVVVSYHVSVQYIDMSLLICKEIFVLFELLGYMHQPLNLLFSHFVVLLLRLRLSIVLELFNFFS